MLSIIRWANFLECVKYEEKIISVCFEELNVFSKYLIFQIIKSIGSTPISWNIILRV